MKVDVSVQYECQNPMSHKRFKNIINKSKYSMVESKRSYSLNHSRISPNRIKIYQNVLNPGKSKSDVRGNLKHKKPMILLSQDTLEIIKNPYQNVNLNRFTSSKGNSHQFWVIQYLEIYKFKRTLNSSSSSSNNSVMF